jgi:hypothetical protein
MANKHKTTKPRGELIRNAEETSQIERYWHLADRPEPRIPPKDYHYVKELAHLQFELIKLQEWVRLHGLRICVLFEGRDAAGKGGVIKRITQSLNPRICRVVALGTPTEKEQGQWYFQRYVAELPSRGEIVLSDRSWYNRAGVEHVMGFCTEEEYREFLRACPLFEEMLIGSGMPPHFPRQLGLRGRASEPSCPTAPSRSTSGGRPRRRSRPSPTASLSRRARSSSASTSAISTGWCRSTLLPRSLPSCSVWGGAGGGSALAGTACFWRPAMMISSPRSASPRSGDRDSSIRSFLRRDPRTSTPSR